MSISNPQYKNYIQYIYKIRIYIHKIRNLHRSGVRLKWGIGGHTSHTFRY